MECLDDATVLAWLDRDPAIDRSRTAEHLDSCPACLELVAELNRSELAPAARYELGDEIAHGGMGRVIAATDRLLGRRVALKTVRVPVAELERRFARELRITARLQHPAIVPIYDAGILPSGESFYAMRRIGGRTLDREIAAARTLGERLALLPAVTAIANAMAYAHGEGVIHRDLKPQNIVIEPFGEAIVIDWGLAKDLRCTEPEPEPELDLDAHGGAEPALGHVTRAGEVIGTPGYMAPEQLDGGVVDERSDVYGLGGVLYHVLTGAPPHPDGAARGAAIAPIETARPDVPADLAAIVSRALAADPAARYPSAAELVADLRRFQAGALVGSHRYTLRELTGKWLRRHRGAVAVASVALIAILALSIAGLRRIIAEREVASAARADAEQQRDAAEALIDFVLHDLRARLEQVGRVDVLAGVGAEVETYYGKRAPRGAADLVRRSSALGVLGDARMASGDLAAALAADQRAVEAATAADDAAALCAARQRVGDVLRMRGELDAAQVEFRACAALARARATGAPTWAALLASSSTELADLARLRGDFGSAATLAADAARAAEGVSGDAALPTWLKATNELGLVAMDRGDVAAAATAFQRALDRVRAAYDAHPADVGLRRSYSDASMEVGRVELRRGDLDAAERAFATSRDVSQALVDRDPANAEWLDDLSSSYDFLAKIAMERDRPGDALGPAQSGLAISKRLAKMDSTNARWARSLAASDMTVAAIHRASSHFDLARTACRDAIAIDEQLVAAHPHDVEAVRDLAIALLTLGDLELSLDNLTAARAALERSAQLRRDQLAAQDSPRTRRELAVIELELSDVLARTDHVASRKAIEEARDLVAPIRSLAGEDAEIRETLGEVDEALGKH